MVRFVFSLLLFVAALAGWSRCAHAEEPERWRNFLESLKSAPEAREKARLARTFAETLEKDGAPLRGRDSIVFVYAPAPGIRPREVRINGDFTGWGPSVVMAPFENTRLFVHVLRGLPADARIEYKFTVDGQETLDPLNPARVDNGVGGENSVVAMAGYRPVTFPDLYEDRLLGRLVSTEFPSRLASNVRRMIIYTPPSYPREPARRYPVVYVHDGGSYLGHARAASVVDHLIAERRIEEIIVVFINPIDRWKEYSRNPLFTRIMLEEVVPSIDQMYRTQARAAGRCVLGASLGGLISLHLGFEHPEVFGMVASQSGAFHRGLNGLIGDVSRAPRKDIRVYLDVGLYDLGEGRRGILEENRAMRAAMEKKGYALLYREYSGGHNWTCWRDQLPTILEWLFGPQRPHK